MLDACPCFHNHMGPEECDFQSLSKTLEIPGMMSFSLHAPSADLDSSLNEAVSKPRSVYLEVSLAGKHRFRGCHSQVSLRRDELFQTKSGGIGSCVLGIGRKG